MFDLSTAISLVLGSSLAIFAYTANRKHSASLLPPGPTTLPLLGNILNFPKSLDTQLFLELTQNYGDIVHLNLLGKRMIILGSYSVASELLITRSANTSDRESPVMAELSGLVWNLLFYPYGPAWRRGRRVLHRFFDSSAVSKFNPTQQRHIRALLNRLLENPDAFIDHLHTLVGATTVDVTYGLDAAGPDHQFLDRLVEFAAASESAFTPGKYVVEALPFLRNLPTWFPWATFHRDAAIYKEFFSAMRNEPFDRTLENMRRGEGNPCIVSAMMSDETGLSGADEQLARDSAGLVYMGGANTINASLQVFFLAMVLHPEAQEKAQAELDAIVGRDRLPRITDRDSLLYVQALILEVLRWKPVTGLGFPHKSRSEDVFRGYTIPKGSLIFASSWAISRDLQMYPDPESFIPERFLRDGALNPDVLDPRCYVFGYGRRICPGRHFVETSLFLTIASVLHTFTIKPRCDASGSPKLPEGTMTPGFLSFPETFQCEISPRSEKVEAMIECE